ncbi:MAG: hypothetical protein K9I69_00100 [Ignavibacteriales bacterium]|nr:hypothetical protein [Ignavibacteriales bacterium]MCF8306576.1 hypothetical protein [Ignavibacteriales bacterium]MCF8316375.1 hypothetical protein [Ignavibacteriales bacterium]MCF8437667.1 hypothetical protein [Ignavibacteriales bacterium]
MKLRTKIYSGFGLLSLMLGIAFIWSTVEISRTGTQVGKMLNEKNELLISAAVIAEELGRLDGDIHYYLLSSDSQFVVDIARIENTISTKIQKLLSASGSPEEKALLLKISENFKILVKELSTFPAKAKNPDKINIYMERGHDILVLLRDQINRYTKDSRAVVVSLSSEIQQNSRRSVMYLGIAIFSVFVFMLIFIFILNYYLLIPIKTINDRVKRFRDQRVPYNVELENDDELKELSDAVRDICENLDSEEKRI